VNAMNPYCEPPNPGSSVRQAHAGPPKRPSDRIAEIPGIGTLGKASMTQDTRSEYYTGVILLMISVVTYSTAGLFTKGVDAGSWEVIFWRGVFAGAFTTAWTINRGTLRQNFLGMGYSGWAVGVIGALGTAAFIPAFKLTTIANVSLIYAVSPLIAALLAWLVMGEKVSSRTMAGCVGALLGVAIIVSGSLGQIELDGDLLALCMTTAMASIMVIYRKYPDTPGPGPAVLQSVLLLPFAATFGNPFDVERTEAYLLSAFGLLFAIASVALAEGAKRIPSGQTALLSSLETPLAPVFAFILFTEVPNLTTFLGGSVVLFAVLFSIRNDT
jgi:drug/metabolite transporter (DMT)-like permease